MPTETIGENTGDDFSGAEDTMLEFNNPNTNNGSDANIRLGNTGSAITFTCLFKNSGLSNISSSATVSSATLYLYEFNGDNGNTLSARHLLRDWVDTQATWNIYSTGNNWTSGGALSDGNDRVGTASDTATTSSTDGYRSFDVTDDTQDEVDDTRWNANIK